MNEPFTLDDMRYSLGSLASQLSHGCGNHGCRIKPPTGQGTNAGCRCNPKAVARQLKDLLWHCEQMGLEWRRKP